MLSYKVQALTYYAQGSNFAVNYFPTGTSLAFQNDLENNVTLSITSGTLNSSDASLAIYDGGGFFRFNSINDTTIIIQYYGISNVKASGDQGNAFRHISFGNSITVDAADDVFIQWDMVLAPSVPIMFIFGVIGLMGCFGGPLYMVYKSKRGNYYDGFVNGVIATAIGIAFLIAWLW